MRGLILAVVDSSIRTLQIGDMTLSHIEYRYTRIYICTHIRARLRYVDSEHDDVYVGQTEPKINEYVLGRWLLLPSVCCKLSLCIARYPKRAQCDRDLRRAFTGISMRFVRGAFAGDYYSGYPPGWIDDPE